ncbi:MAG: DUF4162 domain-containing protein, partial [Thermofilum sp.]
EIAAKLRRVEGVVGAAASIKDPAVGLYEVRVVYQGDEMPREVLSSLISSGARLVSMRSLEPTLEDVFITLTGERLEKQG